MSKLNTIKEALEDLKAGKMIVVVDDEQRENEGDVIVAAEFATPDAINFMVKYARGIVCTPMMAKDLERLEIPLMVEKNTDNHQTAFTVTVDYKDTETGVSPYERSKTILSLFDDTTKPEDLRRPGHVFPLRYCEGGVIKRPGHTEAAVDLARLAGCYPAGVICEITGEDGQMSRLDDLLGFAEKHELKIVSIEDLIVYIKRYECLIHMAATSKLPTKHGDFQIYVYEDELDDRNHLALVKGDVRNKTAVLTRIHSECLTGDIFGSKRCDCGEQLATAMEQIEKEGCGVLVYMRQEGRGIGLVNKIKAYALQEHGLDTVEANEHLGFPADMREYSLSAQILENLGVESIKLMTNNPSKSYGLEEFGVKVEKRIPLITKSNTFNEKYLRTKKIKMGHLLK